VDGKNIGLEFGGGGGCCEVVCCPGNKPNGCVGPVCGGCTDRVGGLRGDGIAIKLSWDGGGGGGTGR
jgi:hypothetical protein